METFKMFLDFCTVVGFMVIMIGLMLAGAVAYCAISGLFKSKAINEDVQSQ